MTIRHLDRLLVPASVAVFGASDRPGRVGTTVWRNLRCGRFAGPVDPVNPRLRQLDGQAVAASVDALPRVPDLAVLCTPPASIPGLIAALGSRGTRAAIVMTAGLTDAQKQAALDAARPHLLRLLGPNCIGLITPRIGLNASFAHVDALDGKLAFVSQSGALLTAMLDWARQRGIGFSHLVSLGEQCDVDVGDLLDLLASDAHTRAILLYVESVQSPRKFMSAARAAARNKPVIIIKAGRSARGRQAAASHTGALTGADIVFDAAIRRAGMLRVDTLAELFLAAQTLASLRDCTAGSLTVLTNGGGGGVIAADAAERHGVPLTELDAPLKAQLDALLPATWSRANPVDLIGDAPIERYTAALSAALAARSDTAVLLLHAPTAIVRSDDIARACAPLARAAAGRMLACWMGDASVARARQIFTDAGIADFATPEEAVHALALLRTWRHNQDSLLQTPSLRQRPASDSARGRAIVQRALADGRAWLEPEEVAALLAAYGIPVVPTRKLPPDPAAAVAAAEALGPAVALKIASQDLPHKSDIGGVALGLRGAAAVRDAAAAMLARVRSARPEARIDGFTLQAMADRPGAHELIVGLSIDALFGPVLLFGAGGTAVEIVADRAVALPPLNAALAAELVDRTRIAKLLAGYRGRPRADLGAVHDVLVAVSQLATDCAEIVELDINPLLVDADGALAVDARVRVSAERPGGAGRFAIRPYPEDEVEHCTWSGAPLELRPIRPEDEAQHSAFLHSLAPEDVRLRTFQVRHDLPRSELARLTQIDYAREMAFVAVAAGSDGQPCTLGVARAVADPDNVEAEFGIIVRSDLKHRGLGRLLLDKLVRYQRAQGTRWLVGDVLRENLPMRELAERLGFEPDPAQGDAQVVHLRKALQDEARAPN